MTPDQLPAGLPMDDKIEAWVQQALQLADARELARANVAASTWSNEARERLARASNDLAAHLRTTPEGYRLVDQRENEALRKDAERYRWLRRKMCFNGNGDGTATMHAINLPNATKFPDVGEVEIGVDAAIDAALKEQNKC